MKKKGKTPRVLSTACYTEKIGFTNLETPEPHNPSRPQRSNIVVLDSLKTLFEKGYV